MEREIKSQQRFDEQLAEIIPDLIWRAEIEAGIRFAIRANPESGQDTGRSSPVPVWAWRIFQTPQNPPLMVVYTFTDTLVLLMAVFETDDDIDDQETA